MTYIYIAIASSIFLLTGCNNTTTKNYNEMEIFPENVIDGISISTPKNNNPGIIDGITYVKPPKITKKNESSKLTSENFSLSDTDFTKNNPLGNKKVNLNKLNETLGEDRFKDILALRESAKKVLENTNKQDKNSQVKQMRGDSYLYLAYTNVNGRESNLNNALAEYQSGEDSSNIPLEKSFFIGAKAFVIKALYFIKKDNTLEKLYESNQLCSNSIELMTKVNITSQIAQPLAKRTQEIKNRCNVLILLNDWQIAKIEKDKAAENKVFNDAIIKFEELSKIDGNGFDYYASLYQYAILASNVDNTYSQQVKKYSKLLGSNIISGNLKKDPEQTLMIPWIM